MTAAALALLLAWTGCRDAPPAAPPGPGPRARAALVRVEVGRALAAAAAGEGERAARIVRLAYRRHFEPVEPLLRVVDPVATLSLEYRFGGLSVELARRSGRAEEIAAGLLDDLDRVAVAAEAGAADGSTSPL